jgi:hypothetical protein
MHNLILLDIIYLRMRANEIDRFLRESTGVTLNMVIPDVPESTLHSVNGIRLVRKVHHCEMRIEYGCGNVRLEHDDVGVINEVVRLRVGHVQGCQVHWITIALVGDVRRR